MKDSLPTSLSTSTWLKANRSLVLTTSQHYGDINEKEEDRGKDKV
jgi:hypothetical protein